MIRLLIITLIIALLCAASVWSAPGDKMLAVPQQGPYGNYSTITFGRYSSTGVGLDRSAAYFTGRSYMYFVGQKLTITTVPPP
jgi:hypothetical protein